MSSGARHSAVEALRPTLSGARADLQERLIYRAHAFIKDEVAGFTPGPQDTDYPSRLEALAAAAAAKAEQRAAEGEISLAGEDGAGQQVRGRGLGGGWKVPGMRTICFESSWWSSWMTRSTWASEATVLYPLGAILSIC